MTWDKNMGTIYMKFGKNILKLQIVFKARGN